MSEKVEKEVKKGSKLKIVIFILLLLILAVVCVLGGYLIAGRNTGKSGAININGNNAVQKPDEKLYSLGDFIVNINNSDSGRYIKADIYLGYLSTNKKMDKELEEKKQIVRDKINMYLMTKQSKDINYNGLLKIKSDILKQINSELTDGQIMHVYFDNILVQ